MAKRRTRFVTWCKRDPNDETKIDYEFKTSDGKVHRFTSDDYVNTSEFGGMYSLRNAWIESIELVEENGSRCWKARLYE